MSEEVVILNRLISREPSEEINYLTNFVPDLYSRKNNHLCDFAPINFIGSLLAHLHPESRLGEWEQIGSVHLYHRIPLLYENQDHQTSGLGIRVDDVLIKNDCGRLDTGVVLTGSFAGLFIDKCHRFTKFYDEGLIINRVWNDELLGYYLDTDGIPGNFGKHDRAFDIIRSDKKMLVEIYRDILNKRGFKWTTEMFFDLCQRANFPVDREAFHFTRSHH